MESKDSVWMPYDSIITIVSKLSIQNRRIKMSRSLGTAYSIYEKAIQFHVGHRCGSYAFCYNLLKLAHNKLSPSRKEKILYDLKAGWNLNDNQISVLLEQLSKFKIPEQQYSLNYLFPKKFYF